MATQNNVIITNSNCLDNQKLNELENKFNLLELQLNNHMNDNGKVKDLTKSQPWLALHGIAARKDDLLIANLWSNKMFSVDKKSKKISVYVDIYEGQSDDIAIGPNNEIAWTQLFGNGNEAGGWVYIKNNDGEPPKKCNPNDNLPSTNSIGFNKVTGQLFVTQCFGANAFWEVDPKGIKKPRKICDTPSVMNGFEIYAPDNSAYATYWFAHQIIKVNCDSGVITVLYQGGPEEVFCAVNLDSQGRVWGCDTRSGYMTCVDRVSGVVLKKIKIAPDSDNFCIDPYDNDMIYVTNYGCNSIYKVNPHSGSVELLVGGDYYTNPQLAVPMGLCLTEDEKKLLVGTFFTYSSVDLETNKISILGGLRGDVLYFPINVALTPTHYILLSNFQAKPMLVPRNNPLNTDNIIIPLGNSKGVRGTYDAMYLSSNNSILVSVNDLNLSGGPNSGRLVECSGTNYQTCIDRVTGLHNPYQMCRDNLGNIYVSDYDKSNDPLKNNFSAGNGKIWKINPLNWSKTIVKDGLKGPQGLALAPNGKLMCLEVDLKRLIEIDPNTSLTRTIVSDLGIGISYPSGYVPTFSYLAIKKDGTIYFTNTYDGKIQYITHDIYM